MKYVSLFAGIGGFDLALTRLGHENVYVNEWDKYAADTYEKNFKHRPDTRDITTVDVSEIPDHDVICGGFPCQSFSIVGKRGGFKDTRGTLFFDVARIAAAKRPSYVFLENVKGLLNHDEGNTFATIISTLDELGYDCQWQVTNSKYFGVPQNRERVFIVGHLRGIRRPQVFPIRGEAEASVGRNGRFIDLQLRGAKITKQTRTIQARYYKGYSSRYGENSGVIAGTLRTFHDGGGFRAMKSEVSPTVTARGREDGNGQPVILQLARGRNKGGKKNLSPTMSANQWEYNNLLESGARIRRLTPLECERLQGFPDNWTQGVSDTQRYKQLGNAVTVNVVEAIANRFLKGGE